MSLIAAPGSWPAAAAPSTRAPSRLGPAPQGPLGHNHNVQGSAAQGMHWALKRNCSFSPRQLMAVYLALCLVSMAIGLGFLSMGVPAVLPFAGVELLAVGVAFAAYARHAADREEITLERGELRSELRVDHYCGRRVDTARFSAAWLHIEPPRGGAALVELTGQGQRIGVGRYLRPELRTALAHELRLALRHERERTAHEELQWEQ